MAPQYYDIQDSRRIFGSEVELMKFLKSLLIKDYKIYEMQNEKGTIVPYHAHAHTETILLLEGVMRIIIEEDLVVKPVGKRQGIVHVILTGNFGGRFLQILYGIGLSGKLNE